MRRFVVLAALVTVPALGAAEDDAAVSLVAWGKALARDSAGVTCDADLALAFESDTDSFTLVEAWRSVDRSSPVCLQMAANSGTTSDRLAAPAAACGAWSPGTRTFANGAHRIYAVSECAGDRVEHFVTLRNGATTVTFSEEFRWASGLSVYGDATLVQRMGG